jgi:hypothetical protein
VNKEQVLFYLKRMLKDYEPDAIDHEEMAKQGLSYEERQRRIKIHEKENPEAAALHAAIEVVDKFYHVKF